MTPRGAKHCRKEVKYRTSHWGSCPSGARRQQILTPASWSPWPAGCPLTWRLPPGRHCARPPAQHAFRRPATTRQLQVPSLTTCYAAAARQQRAERGVLTGGSAAAAWRGSVDSTATNPSDLHLGSGRNERTRRRAAHPTAAGAQQHGARLEGERGFQPSLRAVSGTWQTAGAAEAAERPPRPKQPAAASCAALPARAPTIQQGSRPHDQPTAGLIPTSNFCRADCAGGGRGAAGSSRRRSCGGQARRWWVLWSCALVGLEGLLLVVGARWWCICSALSCGTNHPACCSHHGAVAHSRCVAVAGSSCAHATCRTPPCFCTKPAHPAVARCRTL